MANPQVSAFHAGLFQPQPAVRQVLHDVDQHLQPQFISPPAFQLDGTHQFRYVPEFLYPSGQALIFSSVGSATCEYLMREQANNPLRMQESTIQYHLIAFLISGTI